jgi:hypothetical protein
MFEILVDLFLLRAAKAALTNTAAWPETFVRLCSISRGRVAFELTEFTNRLLNAGAGSLERSALETKVGELRTRLSADFRQQLHGHDLIQILSWYAHQVGVNRAIYNKIALHRGLITSVDLEELIGCALFQGLLAWSAPAV